MSFALARLCIAVTPAVAFALLAIVPSAHADAAASAQLKVSGAAA